MDPSDVEMEPAEHPPQPQQPPPQQPAAAAGDGWSMLSRARGLLEEGQPSLALQAVRTLAPLPLPSHPLFPFRLHFVCFVASRPSPRVPEREIRQVIDTHHTRPRSITRLERTRWSFADLISFWIFFSVV
jgi:hypothetical protein